MMAAVMLLIMNLFASLLLTMIPRSYCLIYYPEMNPYQKVILQIYYQMAIFVYHSF